VVERGGIHGRGESRGKAFDDRSGMRPNQTLYAQAELGYGHETGMPTCQETVEGGPCEVRGRKQVERGSYRVKSSRREIDPFEKNGMMTAAGATSGRKALSSRTKMQL